MRLSRKLQVVAAIALGAAVGAAFAGQLSARNSSSSNQREGAIGLVDTSGVCASDYCGCFEDLSRSRVLTNATPRDDGRGALEGR